MVQRPQRVQKSLLYPLALFIRSPLFLTPYDSWYVLAPSSRTGINSLKLGTDQLHFDTQSAEYQTQDRVFLSFLIITGNVLVPLIVLSAHPSRNQYSKSPIFMNRCNSYSLIFYILLL
jgi:hypothetical protein